ncbi:hypothetical protein AB6E53_02235 [Vibrio breoganii]|uniref:DUF3672 domain-containing protein n=1 Tax=Vibrio breoganii TaxID=553239 RepID=A0AAP8MVI3_9VIBR|nr:hypothetical protein [Vibrio breoganii]PMP10205.1 hypothetical protein BCS93_11055 [Vibrio breoganii]
MKLSKSKRFRAGRNQETITENVEILTGQRGSPLDRALTMRDLVEAGLANAKGVLSSNTVAEGIAPKLDLGEGVQIPHAPVGVAAYGGFATVTLTWDNPTFRGFAHAEIFRSAYDNDGLPIDDVTQATLIATTPALVFGDSVETYSSHYYWVRFVNTNGYQGAFQSVGGVFCETTETEQVIVADRVVSGIEVISPVIRGGEVIGSIVKVGAGGPYAGYHTYIDSVGKLYTDNIVAKGHIEATSGSFPASLMTGVLTADHIDTSSMVLAGQSVIQKSLATGSDRILTASYVQCASTRVNIKNRNSNTRIAVVFSFTLDQGESLSSNYIDVQIRVDGGTTRTFSIPSSFASGNSYVCGDSGSCYESFHILPTSISNQYWFTTNTSACDVSLWVKIRDTTKSNKIQNVTLSADAGVYI